MADEKNSTEEELEIKPKSSKMGLIIVVNLILVGGVLAYIFVFSKSEPPPAAGGGGAKAEELAPAPTGEPGPLLKLNDFIVNLADREANRYLKLGLALEMADDDTLKKGTEREPIVRDSVIQLISSLTYKQVRTQQGKKELRKNLLDKLSDVLGRGLVKGVYFTEFVVQ